MSSKDSVTAVRVFVPRSTGMAGEGEASIATSEAIAIVGELGGMPR